MKSEVGRKKEKPYLKKSKIFLMRRILKILPLLGTNNLSKNLGGFNESPSFYRAGFFISRLDIY